MKRKFVPLHWVAKAEESISATDEGVHNGKPAWPIETRFVAGLDGNPTSRSLMGDPFVFSAREMVGKKA